MKITTNNHERPLLAYYELTEKQRRDVDYMGALDESNPDHLTDRFFIFRGSTWDTHEFERASGEDLKAWHGVQGTSYFDAVVLRFKDGDFGGVVVGHASW